MKTTSANRETGQAPALKISALTVQAGHGATRRPVIENISFEVYPGETLCVVGESGSGKSVTSLAAMGLLPKGVLTATAGSILLGNDDVLQATPDRLRALRASRIAMVFQEPMTALNPVENF